MRWSKGAARLSCDSPKAPSRRPPGALKDPWRYVEHRAAAVQAPYVSLAMLNFPGRPSHGDCEYHPFGEPARLPPGHRRSILRTPYHYQRLNVVEYVTTHAAEIKFAR